MSSKSLDPISRRSKKATTKESVVPHSADAGVVLEKAKAAIEARKEAKSRSNRKLIFGILVIALVIFLVGGGLLALNKYYKDKYIATIDGNKIERKDYEKLIEQAKATSLSDEDAANRYFDMMKRKYASQKMNLSMSEDLTNYTAATLYYPRKYNQLNDWEKMNVYDEAIKSSLLFSTYGGYQGAIFYFPFSMHQETLGYAYKDNIPEGWRVQSFIESDKQYADQKASEMYQKIKSGASIDEVMNTIISDNRLQYAGAANQSHSFDMTVDPITNTLGEYLNNGMFRTTISKDISLESLKKESSVGISDIKTGKMIFYDKAGAPEYDAYYYFYKIDRYVEPDSEVKKQFENNVNSIKVEKHG